MRVLLTGAFGRVGSGIVEHLGPRSEFAFTYLDIDEHEDHDSQGVDVTDYDALYEAVEGHDAVIHLAAIPNEAPWGDLLETNLIGTYNAYEAAKQADVDSFVFASSNHVVGTVQERHAPELYHPSYDLLLTHDVEPCPKTVYGVTKLFGEGLGHYYASHEPAPTRCYSLRICGTRYPADDHPWSDAERGVVGGEWDRGSTGYWEQAAKRMAMGTTSRDFARAIECCLTDNTVEHTACYVTSDNPASWFDLEHTRAAIGYEPVDDLSAWDGPVPAGVPRELPAAAPGWLPDYVLPK